MHITEMILDGFKSYPNRTVIDGWDPEFNAITGLNGSGKSNILDAICFVLGISNLTQVRASNLQDLVYKRGQAGITKASVTIEFDNSDPNSCPVGYEQYSKITVTRQIVLGGHNKYLINGHNAQQNSVANLFQSVQLNVNNPHFLIMQGRITKVLNMKPPEILAMIEEAAGTRMFEDKKESALSTIEKKEKKLREIQTLLDEEITPKLDKLRKERTLYLEFERTKTELERIQKFCFAYEYTMLQGKLNSSQTDLEAKTKRIAMLEKESATLHSEIKASDSELQRVRAQRQKEMAGLLDGLDARLGKLQEDLVRTKTQSDLKAESVAEDERTIAKLRTSIGEAEAAVQAKITELARLETDFAADKAAYDAKAEEVRRTDDLLSALTTGLSSGDGEKGYMEQLQVAKNRVGQVASETKQAQLKLDHLKAEIKEVEPKVKQLEKSNTKLQGQVDELTKALEAAKTKLSKLSFDQTQHEDLVRQKAVEEQAIAALRERLDALSDRVSPVRSVMAELGNKFSRQQVKGLLAELITIPAAHREAATALEIAAGGRLYSVVVQDEKVGSSVLQTPLKRRVLIIPLNKIQRSSLTAEKAAEVQQLAPGRVDVALSLVGFPDEVEAAMNFVFGSTMICKDQDAAKRVTFEGKVRSVTLEGDVYEPTGTISGGSAARGSNILISLQQLHEAQAELETHQAELARLTAAVENGAKTMKLARETQSAIELKAHELALAKQQLEQSAHAQAQQQLATLRAQMLEHQATIDSATTREKEAQAEVKRIEKEMKELSENRDGKLKAMKSQLTKLKQELAAFTRAHKDRQQQQDTLKLEIEQAKRDVTALNEQLKAAQASLAEQQKLLRALLVELERVTGEYNAIKKTQAAERDRLARFDDEIRSLEGNIKQRTDSLDECELEAKKLSHDVARYHKEREETAKSVLAMEKKHDWILNQRQLFGQPGSQYDFASQDPAQAAKRRDQLEEAQARLAKNVNHKVANMMDRVEKEEKALKEKLATVLNDKYKIEDTIKTLDVKKQEALRKTWEKVNGDFGAIFGDLLPGNTCKLDAPEGQDITDGLEIKVNLGGVWKQSLTELSGGQRSLVALSLILSLLSYKPAPLYILDEIDAALDLSHTQNIGQLLKTRFKGAQFIVVSLKEGMFNNANVLFRARFRDGASQVERIAQAKTKTIKA